MKTKVLYLLLFWMVVVFIQPSFAQEDEGDHGAKEEKTELPTEGGALNNQTLFVKNFSFFRKASPDGRGEQLEIFFNIINAKEKSRNLAVTVVAFNEKDHTDNPMRKYIEYPKWRTVDLDKRLKMINRFRSVPEIDKSVIDPNKKGDDEYPNFLEYTDYISKNPQSGIKIPLQGYREAKLIEEQTKDYNLISKSLDSAVFVRFFKEYDYFQKKNDFFNYIGIFIYDVDMGELVYRQFFHFTKPPRLY